MLISELIQRALKGELRFQFIESTVITTEGHAFAQLKGRAQAEPADDAFLFHFNPNGPLAPEWTEPDGYLGNEVKAENVRRFSASGVERGSANWSGSINDLRYVRSAQGPALHGRVKQWTRVDDRSVHSSFMRIVVPGRHLYPAIIRHAPGYDTRSASVCVNDVELEFRDHGDYTEIFALNAVELPELVGEAAVDALGRVLNWVYRERHKDKHRVVTVQLAGSPSNTVASSLRSDSSASPRYQEFWDSYSDVLTGLL